MCEHGVISCVGVLQSKRWHGGEKLKTAEATLAVFRLSRELNIGQGRVKAWPSLLVQSLQPVVTGDDVAAGGPDWM